MNDSEKKSSDQPEFHRILEEHPLYSSLKEQSSSALVEQLTAAMEAFWRPDSKTQKNWIKAWASYQQDMLKLWTAQLPGASSDGAVVEPDETDRRFADSQWREIPFFDVLKQSYLLFARTFISAADGAGLKDQDQRKLSFYSRFMVDALSPSNFALTNPEALDAAVKTRGQSLAEGFKNMLDDLQKGAISSTDGSAFEVGKNLGTTPGSVIFRNELFELIHYKPVAKEVSAQPLVVIPPCVNKFYIFDLNERKSMVRYALEQGRNLFMMSWRNPGPEQAGLTWEDYIGDGIYKALDVARKVTKAKKADVLSWCNGGTMAIAALAVMTKAQQEKIGTATFLSSMIDFSDPGDVEVFIDRRQLDLQKGFLQKAGVLPGQTLAKAMAMLHSNEAIWHYVINNYLLGKTPPPFDVLYWNEDTSNLPAEWYRYYVEQMYLDNKLKEPGALTLMGKPVDTHNIGVPCYFLAATEDHIVPWKTSYLAKDLVRGEAEFVLSTGGHVSGTVINHPLKNRKLFYTDGDTDKDAEGWKETATATEGSWWPHWFNWLNRHDGGRHIPAPKKLGNSEFPVLEAAPGFYVIEDVAQGF